MWDGNVQDGDAVPGKLVLTKYHELATQLLDDLGLVVRLTVLQHVLNNIVAILVVYEVLRLLVQFTEDSRHLVDVAVLQDALDHSTAVRMHCQLQYLNTPSQCDVCLVTFPGLDTENFYFQGRKILKFQDIRTTYSH